MRTFPCRAKQKMNYTNLLLIAVFAVLNWTRGYHWRPLSIALMSILMGFYWASRLGIWWMLFAVGIPMGVALGLHDQNRGVWCSLVAVGASVVLLVTGHLPWYWFAAYCALNYALGAILVKNKAKQKVIDPVTGAGFGLLIFL
jgi:hypothetical protein